MRKIPTSRAADCTVQKYVGTAYDEVKIVADNIEAVKSASVIAGDLSKVVPYLEDIENCSDNIAAIKDAPAQAILAKESADKAQAETIKAEHASTVAETAKDITTTKAAEAAQQADTATQQATLAGTKATEAAASATSAKDSADQSQIIYEAFAKGAVYRGGWNPKTSAYPDAGSPTKTNSYWDVWLDEGTSELIWNGITWYGGDRLIYSVPDNKYFHIGRTGASSGGVLSVNGMTGAVNLSLDTLKGNLDLETKKADTHLILRHDDVKGSTPLASDLVKGEVVLNTADKKLFSKDTNDQIISIGGGEGVGVPNFKVVAYDITGVVGEGYLLDCTLAPRTFTFPTGTAGKGETVTVGDYKGTASILNPIILTSNQLIDSGSDDMYITSPGRFVWQYIDDVVGWYCVDGIGEGGGSGELPYEEVIILPVGEYANGGTFTLPEGYTWADFERVEVAMGVANNVQTRSSSFITKEQIARHPTTFGILCWDLAYHAGFTATTANTGIIAVGVANQPLQFIKGYTKYKPVLNRGVTGSFTTTDGKTITITNGVVTAIN